MRMGRKTVRIQPLTLPADRPLVHRPPIWLKGFAQTEGTPGMLAPADSRSGPDRAQRLLRDVRARDRLGPSARASRPWPRPGTAGRSARSGSPRTRPASSRRSRSGSRSSASSPAPTAVPPCPSRLPRRCGGCRRSPMSRGTLAFALVVIATTYLSLIIGELVPKTPGAAQRRGHRRLGLRPDAVLVGGRPARRLVPAHLDRGRAQAPRGPRRARRARSPRRRSRR